MKYIQKKALELGISQNALMNILLNLGSQVMDINALADFFQNSQCLLK
ncbi:Toxin-antitoxin system, antitoxin component [Fusobacterium necrophorum subsp. funduliforme]